eukprot:CAMPEP_0194094442 /NCGR_PEP_ID=MMETSP0149-20130528/54079_1 /TAXON_ID=122233 /ORGANISM="Chaetoceros debilis, Strain MM31A-1" /LENGTH=383 /DNA_ID=CAMNT_0038780097 /DNA_START=154 /DNA_END=1301 /DNA_ORIENTATION=-
MTYRRHARSLSPSSRTEASSILGVNSIESIIHIFGACFSGCFFVDSPTYSVVSKRSKRSKKSWKADFDDNTLENIDDETEATAGSSYSEKQKRAKKYKKGSKDSSPSKDSPRTRSRSLSRSNSKSRARRTSFRGASKSKSKKSIRSRSSSSSRSRSRTPRRKSPQRSSSAKRSSRSRQRVKSRGSSLEPVPFRLNSEIEVALSEDQDDMSAISAGTLEHLVAKQERIAVLNYANEKLKVQRRGSPDHEHMSFPQSPNRFAPNLFDKENVINGNLPSDVSISAASLATTESAFDSVWKKPEESSNHHSEGESRKYKTLDEYASCRKNADNSHSSAGGIQPMARAQNGSRGLSSRRAQKWETPNSRKMRRQIQRDGIGSIPEMSG